MRSSRVQKRARLPHEISTARTAIRNHCLECCGYESAEVVRCTAPACWLYPYRLGAHVAPEEALRDSKDAATGVISVQIGTAEGGDDHE